MYKVKNEDIRMMLLLIIVLVSLLLILLNRFCTYFSFSIVDFEQVNASWIFFFFFFYLGFSFTNIQESLPLPLASQTLRHQPSDYCRELTSSHGQHLDLNREPLVSKRKLLTTKLHALCILQFVQAIKKLKVIHNTGQKLGR